MKTIKINHSNYLFDDFVTNEQILEWFKNELPYLDLQNVEPYMMYLTGSGSIQIIGNRIDILFYIEPIKLITIKNQ